MVPAGTGQRKTPTGPWTDRGIDCVPPLQTAQLMSWPQHIGDLTLP